MILYIKKILLFAFCLSAMACQRAAEDKSSIVISLPPSEKLNSFSCTSCLKFLAVNVSGEGINSTIYVKKEHRDFSEASSEISSEIEIEVPVGKQRLFQVLAAYSNSANDIEIKYGTAIADLTSSTSELPMTIASYGNFEGGHIAGRFLTGTNMGPTGTVNVNIIPEPGRRAFTLFKTKIVNGWFNFFASKNFAVTYELEGGMPILSNIKLNEKFLPAELVGNTQVVRVVRPMSYYRFNGSTWDLESEDDSDLVIGYFFAPGVSDSNKKVCKQISPLDLLNLSSNVSGTPFLVYDPTATSGDVLVHGGATTVQYADCAISTPQQQYGPDTIYVDGRQFDGMGNDTAKSIEGAFSYFKLSGQIKKYSLAANTYSFRFLPHLLGNLYDGAKLYRAGNQPENEDNITCNSESLTTNGFSEVPLSATTIAGTLLSMTTTAAFGSGYALLCPTKAGEVRGHGGMYLGSLATPGSPTVLAISDGPTYNYGTVAIGSVINYQFTVTNSGGSNATGLGGTGLAAPFQFVGGSYPGTGGTCGAVLIPGGTCTVVVEFSPVAAMVSNDTVIIGYNDGSAAQTASRDITGTGAIPAVLVITGNTSLTSVVAATPPTVYELYTVTNTGSVQATAMSGLSLTGPFSFVGGSYPGSGGGTCGATLASGATCLIRVEYTAVTYVLSNQTIQIPYNNGNTGQTATLVISGTGI